MPLSSGPGVRYDSGMSNDEVGDRQVPLRIPADEFRAIGHWLVDEVAAFFESLPSRPVTRGDTPASIRPRAALTASRIEAE